MAKKLNYDFYDIDVKIKKKYKITLEEFVKSDNLKERDRKRTSIVNNLVMKIMLCIKMMNKNAHKDHYMRDILKDLYYGFICESILNKLDINGANPNKAADLIIKEYGL